MKVLIVTLGSRGDVNPFLVVGLKLKQKGHEVVFCCEENFRRLAEGFGLRFIPHLNSTEHDEVANDPNLWHYRKALPTFCEKSLVPNLRKIYRIIEQERAGDFLVISNPFAFAAKIAEEKLGIKLVQLHLWPSLFRTLQDTSQVGRLPMHESLPTFYKKCVWWLIDACILDPCIKKELNRFRKGLGLKPSMRIMHNWWFSKHYNAMVFSEHFAEKQKDWPEPSEVFDFLCFDGEEGISTEAEKFLHQGSRPIVFTSGTAFNFGKSFFQESLKALRKLTLRGIFLTQNQGDIPEELPEYIFACNFLPLGKILPRCSAIVHHGGIGTLAQAAKAGIPQLIRPLAFDQPDNAYRIYKRKLGNYILAHHYKADKLYKKLQKILNDEEIKANCIEISKKINSDRALENLVQRIEDKSVAVLS